MADEKYPHKIKDLSGSNVDNSSEDTFYFRAETDGESDGESTGTLTPDGAKTYISANSIPQESTLDPDTSSHDSFFEVFLDPVLENSTIAGDDFSA